MTAAKMLRVLTDCQCELSQMRSDRVRNYLFVCWKIYQCGVLDYPAEQQIRFWFGGQWGYRVFAPARFRAGVPVGVVGEASLKLGDIYDLD